MQSLWATVDDRVVSEVQEYISAPNQCPVDIRSLTALPLKLGGFGYPSYNTLVTITYPLAKAQSLHLLGFLGLRPAMTIQPPAQRTVLNPIYAVQAAAIRAALPEAYRSLFDDHNSPSSYAFLLQSPSSEAFVLSDADFRFGCLARAHVSGFKGRCNCGASADIPNHDLCCPLAGPYRTRKSYFVRNCLMRGLQLSGAHVTSEPCGALPEDPVLRLLQKLLCVFPAVPTSVRWVARLRALPQRTLTFQLRLHSTLP